MLGVVAGPVLVELVVQAKSLAALWSRAGIARQVRNVVGTKQERFPATARPQLFVSVSTQVTAKTLYGFELFGVGAADENASEMAVVLDSLVGENLIAMQEFVVADFAKMRPS